MTVCRGRIISAKAYELFLSLLRRHPTLSAALGWTTFSAKACGINSSILHHC